jgi:hypothetical protein
MHLERDVTPAKYFSCKKCLGNDRHQVWPFGVASENINTSYKSEMIYEYEFYNAVYSALPGIYAMPTRLII